MMRNLTIAIALVGATSLPLTLAACGGGESKQKSEPTEEEASSVDAVAIGKLAAKIRANPDKADELLEEAGMDQAAFEEALFEIAASPKLTQAYRQALAAK